MTRQRLPLIALMTLGSASMLAGLVFLVLSLDVPVPDSWGFRGFTALFTPVFGGMGALVAYRKPGNPIGWLLLVAGTLGGVQVLAEEYAIYGVVGRGVPLPGAVFAGWVETWIWLVTVPVVIVYTLALFPDGTYLSRRWHALGWLTGIDVAVAAGGLAFQAGPLNNAPFIDNPFPLIGDLGHVVYQGQATTLVFYIGFLGLGLLAAAAAASVVVRYRRSSGVPRQQLKWLVLAAIVLTLITSLQTVVQVLAPDVKGFQLLFIGGLAFLPIAIGVAILRHGLYEIDVIINRALVYGATSAAIGAVFFLGIVVLQTLLRPITGGSQIAVAVSTLLCFALFQPVQRRAQHGVDRRFYRAKYDASRTVEAFTERLSGMVELGAVRAGLLDAVGETFEPKSASIWLASVTLPGRPADRTES